MNGVHTVELLTICCIIFIAMGKLLVYLFKKLDKMDQMLQVQSTLIQGLIEDLRRHETVKTELIQETNETEDAKPLEETIPVQNNIDSCSGFQNCQQPLIEKEMQQQDSCAKDFKNNTSYDEELLSGAFGKIDKVNYDLMKDDIPEDFEDLKTDSTPDKTYELATDSALGHCTLVLDGNNASTKIIYDTADEDNINKASYVVKVYINKDVTCVMIGDQNTFSVHPDGPNETCKMTPTRGRDYSNPPRVHKKKRTKPNIKKVHQIKDPSQCRFGKGRKKKQSYKFGMPVRNDANLENKLQERFTELARSQQTNNSNQNLGFVGKEYTKSNRDQPSLPEQTKERRCINKVGEGRYSGTSMRPDYCNDPDMVTEAIAGERAEETRCSYIWPREGYDNGTFWDCKIEHQSLQNLEKENNGIIYTVD